MSVQHSLEQGGIDMASQGEALQRVLVQGCEQVACRVSRLPSSQASHRLLRVSTRGAEGWAPSFLVIVELAIRLVVAYFHSDAIQGW